MSVDSVVSIECEMHMILGCATCAPPLVATTTFHPVTARPDRRVGGHTIPQQIPVTTALEWTHKAFLAEVHNLKIKNADVAGYGARDIARDMRTPTRRVTRSSVRNALRELERTEEEHPNRAQRRQYLFSEKVPVDVRAEVQTALASRDYAAILNILNLD